MLHTLGSKIRKLVFFVTALVSLFIFIFLRPEVEVEPYLEEDNETEEQSDQYDGTDEHWTKKTRGHKMAVAIGNSLSPEIEEENDEKKYGDE